MEERIISLNLFEPGFIMGLWESLDKDTSYLPKRVWQVSAGARSILMLPKITDIGNHKILERRFDLEHSVPKSLINHWNEFVRIANHPNFKQEWYCELILLPKPFFEKLDSIDNKWYDFQNYLKDLGWSQSGYWRNKITYDIIWEMHFAELDRFNAKPNPYDIHVAKHMGLLGMGVLPALTPAINDDCAPISGLQDVYTYQYGQKIYIPTIMVPTHLSKNKPEIKGYYSLRFPTLFEAVPKTRNYPSVLHDLRHIKRVEQKFRQSVLNGQLPIEETPFFDFVKNVHIEYFHSEKDDYYGIIDTQIMPIEDKRLIHYSNKMEKMTFSANNPFVRGCMRLSYKNHKLSKLTA